MARKGHFVFFLPSFLSFTKGTRWGTEGFHWRGWSPYLFTVVRRTCAYTRQSGITSHGCIVELWAGFPPKATRARIYAETFIQLRSFGGDEREREEKKEQTTAVGLNGSTTDERVRNMQSRPKGSTL